jgi:Tol biopolymer transport system component
MPTTGGTPQLVCEDCGQATSWSSDGKRIIGNSLKGQTWILDLVSARKRDLLATHHNAGPGPLSPDNRWLSLFDGTSSRCYIAPVKEAPVAESAWVYIIDGEPRAWSPDGNLLYAISDRDGHTCVWARRLDAVTKQHRTAIPRVSLARRAAVTRRRYDSRTRW